MTYQFDTMMKLARQNSSMSLRKLSELAGVSPSQLSQYERGNTYPNKLIVMKIANALELPLNDALVAAGYVPGIASLMSFDETEENSNEDTVVKVQDAVVRGIIKNSLLPQVRSLLSKTEVRSLSRSIEDALAYREHLSMEELRVALDIERSLEDLKEAADRLGSLQRGVGYRDYHANK